MKSQRKYKKLKRRPQGGLRLVICLTLREGVHQGIIDAIEAAPKGEVAATIIKLMLRGGAQSKHNQSTIEKPRINVDSLGIDL